MPTSLPLGLNALAGALFLLLAFRFLATRQVAMLLQTFVRQALLLSASALIEAVVFHSGEFLLVAALTVASKAFLIPWVLRRNLGPAVTSRREVSLAVGVPTSLLAALLLTAGAYLVAAPLTGPAPGFVSVNLPVGLGALFISIYALAVRREAVPQFLGLLMLDNAVFFAGISLAQSSAVWELAAALEALVLAVIVTLLTKTIAERIGTRVESLASLREEGPR